MLEHGGDQFQIANLVIDQQNASEPLVHARDLATPVGRVEDMEKSATTVELSLGPEVLGQRLDAVLVERMPGWSRTRLQELIKAGRVQLDGRTLTKPGHLLEQAGALRLDCAQEAQSTPASLPQITVLHEDEALLAVDKPAGVLSHANEGKREAGIAEWARERYGELPGLEDEDRGGLAHRLDRDTSGVLLLAKTEAALAGLKAAFHDRKVKKQYLALVHGAPRFDSEWIENWIGRSERTRDKIVVLPEGEGRFASTYYETQERFRDFAFLAVYPQTGRMHQVRVHMAHVGHPLLGDPVYKPVRKHLTPLPPEAPQLTRHALHAAILEFEHPVSGQLISIQSALPHDMQQVLDWLRVHRPD
jgi:23S rRNA pseudouridine1911/1915/1917 synthase